MTQIELKLALSDALAREAEKAGLLTATEIERLLREEVQRRKVAQLFTAADRLADLPGAAMSDDEIEAEIRAVRSARNRDDAGRR